MTALTITALLFPVAGCIFGRRPIAECFLLGIGVVGSAEFILGLLHVPLIVTAALCVVAGLIGFVWGPASAGHDRLKRVHTLIIIIPLVVLAFSAAIIPLHDFDGRAFWVLKAKALAHERTIDGPFFHNAVVNDPRNQYPLLLPLDAATVMIASGDLDDMQVRWLYLFTFAALVMVVAQRINPWCAAILAWIPQFTVSQEGGALTAYADIAVAAFVTCAFLELVERGSPLRFGLWLSFLVLTKNEGLPIAVVLLTFGLIQFRRLITLAPVVVAIESLLVWRAIVPKTDEEDFLALLPSLPSRLNRLIPAVVESGKHLFAISTWGLFWIAALVALGLLAWKKEWQAPAVVLAISAVYISAYMVTHWTMRDLIHASADRLLMHMIGPALFALSRAIDASARNRYSPPEYQPRPA